MSPPTLPGRCDRSDLPWRKLRNHMTATTLEACAAPHAAACSPLAHVRCFRPSRHSLVTSGKRAEKKKNLERMNAPKREQISGARSGGRGGGHGREEGGFERKPAALTHVPLAWASDAPQAPSRS